MPGALRLGAATGATAELFFGTAIGWASSRGREGKGETLSEKSRVSSKDPGGRGDPDIILTLDLYFHFVHHVVPVLIQFQSCLELATEGGIHDINNQRMNCTH